MGLHGSDWDEACLHCKGYPAEHYPHCTCTDTVILRRRERGRNTFATDLSFAPKCPDTIPPWMSLAADGEFKLPPPEDDGGEPDFDGELDDDPDFY